ncbi:phosphate signaling complex protein PhoU [Klugiella xanthotipulae]|uniref:Phosphate-specific transport system accessory protein PhoU n=1 Tax=Klugiella xanthotipulae TaxID=244735 RepID=A0A543HYG8_9MICO|nr:phosphate signaling complex protein PhoU [Klugiella xanthotipulae]TQM63359.1 PhoU-like phosphate uptake regulator [Klugiella xanthotipulae]
MREVFQQELREVQTGLADISELVESAIQRGTQAFQTSDVALAEAVIEDDLRIDALATSLDELAITILARQQPVARDLRIIVSALRISASLERMGDIAEHIAQLARYRFPDSVIPKGLGKIFREMGELDIAVAADVTRLLRTEDIVLIDEIRNRDDRIDELHAKVFEKVLSDTFKGEVTNVVDATLASRYHERFADHAVSIAKKVQYLTTGEYS